MGDDLDYKPKEVRAAKFADEEVELDNTAFIECDFERCVFVYSGGNPFILQGGKVVECHFEFRGAADRTLDTLKTMYRFGMHEFVEMLFTKVRNPFDDPTH